MPVGFGHTGVGIVSRSRGRGRCQGRPAPPAGDSRLWRLGATVSLWPAGDGGGHEGHGGARGAAHAGGARLTPHHPGCQACAPHDAAAPLSSHSASWSSAPTARRLLAATHFPWYVVHPLIPNDLSSSLWRPVFQGMHEACTHDAAPAMLACLGRNEIVTTLDAQASGPTVTWISLRQSTRDVCEAWKPLTGRWHMVACMTASL